MKIYLLLALLTTAGACTQYSVSTNEIISSADRKMGVVSPSGKLLIDTIYSSVSLFYNGGRKVYPPKEQPTNDPVEFYLVRNDAGQLAVFDSGGSKHFGFVDAEQIAIDPHTETIVTTVRGADNRQRSYLYDFDEDLLFERSFEDIAYIKDADLIALIAQDGRIEEYYLYNPFTEEKLGPFTHFNVYNADSSPPLGMDKAAFEPYTRLNVITVRQTEDNDYIWGMFDLQGEQVYPIAYKYFRIIDEDLRKRFIDRAEKPAEVEFLFYGHFAKETSQMMLFDRHLNRYLLETGLNKIFKLNDRKG